MTEARVTSLDVARMAGVSQSAVSRVFSGASASKTTIAKVTKYMLPFFASMILALMVITYVPRVSLWLPVQTGQLKAEEVEQSVETWNQNLYHQDSKTDSESE